MQEEKKDERKKKPPKEIPRSLAGAQDVSLS